MTMQTTDRMMDQGVAVRADRGMGRAAHGPNHAMVRVANWPADPTMAWPQLSRAAGGGWGWVEWGYGEG